MIKQSSQIFKLRNESSTNTGSFLHFYLFYLMPNEAFRKHKIER